MANNLGNSGYSRRLKQDKKEIRLPYQPYYSCQCCGKPVTTGKICSSCADFIRMKIAEERRNKRK